MVPPFVPLALAWLLGLWLAERAAIPAAGWAGLLALAAGSLLAALARPTLHKPFTHDAAVMAALLLVLFSAGGLRIMRGGATGSGLAAYHNSGRVTVIGTVERYPDPKERHVTYVLAVDAVRPEGAQEGTPTQGRMIVNLPFQPDYRYGDQLRLSGFAEAPPRDGEFDYRAYLAMQGIHTLFRAEAVTVEAQGQGAPLFQALNGWRARAEASTRAALPEPHASLLNGILLGLDGAIPRAVQEAFSATGTTHVLVISGANFSVLAAVVTHMGQAWFGRRRGLWLALGFIGLYALFVGAGAPVLRAAIMGSIGVFAVLTRRSALALNSLAAAVVLYTLIYPAQRGDVGFQMSALATAGLILIVPHLSKVTERLLGALRLQAIAARRVPRLLSEGLLVTIAAQAATTPLIVGTFERLSMVSLLANFLILPVQPLIMQSGVVATVAGMAAEPLGRIAGVVPYLGLAWMLAVVEGLARLPFASVAVNGVSSEQVWAFYGLVGAAVWLMALPEREKARSPFNAPSLFGLTRGGALLWGGALAAGLLLLWITAQRPDGRLHLYMLDVGQGDALLIVTPDGKQIVIDGGESPAPLLRGVGQVMPFWDRQVEMVVLTHPDRDHMGGLPELLARYEVATILDSGHPGGSELYGAWQTQVTAEGAQVVAAEAGQLFTLGGGVTATVLAPDSRRFEESNQNSVVIELRYGQFCALLTGDIDLEREQQLVTENRLSACQVLKVAHHGSESSSSVGFLEQVAPQIALVSAGSGNPFGHPAPQVVARLEARGTRLLRTDLHGTVHLATDGEQLWITAERE